MIRCPLRPRFSPVFCALLAALALATLASASGTLGRERPGESTGGGRGRGGNPKRSRSGIVQ